MAYFPTEGDDILDGTEGPDLIDGLGGNDLIRTWGGDDTLIGGAGDDFLQPGTGSDMLIGGAGDDWYYQTDRADTVIEAAGEGFDQMWFKDDTYTGIVQVPLNIERFVLQGQFRGHNDMAAQGNAQDNIILGNNTGNDRIWGGAGNDTIQGDFAAVQAPQSNASASGNDTIHGDDGDDVIWGDQGLPFIGDPGNDVLYGDAGNDQLYGQRGDDTLYGGAGNDVLAGGPGSDVIDGGGGHDTLLFFQGDGQDRYRAPAANASGQDSGTIDLAGYFPGVAGGPRTGLAAGDIAFARQGDDLLLTVKGTADAILVEAYFARDAAGRYPVQHVVLQGGATLDNADIAALLPLAGGDRHDVLRGDDGDNVILGGAGDDILIGGAGNDFLDGQLGRDRMAGGPGDDTMVVDNPRDRVVEKAGEGNDTVQSYIDYTLGDHVENLVLIGEVATFGGGNALDNVLVGNALFNELRGWAGNDVLYGNGGFDFLDGGLGADTMVGGAGNDEMVVDDPGDVVVEELSDGGRDRVQTYISYTLPAAVEDMIVLGGAGVVAIGNAAQNIIIGGAGDDFIDGLGLADVMYGGAGNDTIVMDDVLDTPDGQAGHNTLLIDASLQQVDLTGRGGVAAFNIETVALANGTATTLTLTAADVRGLAPLTHQLRIEGEAGDVTRIEAGWTQVAGAPAGYDQYVFGSGDTTAVLLVGQAVAVEIAA